MTMSIMPIPRNFLVVLHDDTPELYLSFVKDVKNFGMNNACHKWAPKIRHSEQSMLRQAWAFIKNPKYFWFARDVYGEEEAKKRQAVDYDEKPIKKKVVVKSNQITVQKTAEIQAPVVPDKEPGTLTTEETELLAHFQAGEIGFDKMQHELAYRLFKKILQYPELIKVSDWLKSEVIKIQREEMNLKREQMERSWALLLGGFQIPDHCPHCGFELIKKTALDPTLEGEVVTEGNNDLESARPSTSN